MVATRRRIDAWRATKLTPRHDAHIVRQTAIVEIVHQRGDGLIEDRQHFATVSEICSMPVEVRERHSDTPHARFDQTASHQKPRDQRPITEVRVGQNLFVVGSIPLADLRIFAIQVESLHHAAGSEDIEGLLDLCLQPAKRSPRIGLAPKTVKRRE